MPVDTPSPYYEKMLPKWQRCRDAFEGSDAVKAKTTHYLPKIDDIQTDAQYAAYLLRAMFFPAFGRTVQGMAGAVFQKEITVSVPPGIEDHINDITLAGETLETFSYETLIEKLITGRYGILVDMATEGGRPYLLRYRAEDIISVWRERFEGAEILTRVALQESIQGPDEKDEHAKKQIHQIRLLELVEGRYQVRLWRKKDGTSGEYIEHTPEGQEAHETIPLRRAEALPFIPFVLPDDQKPPLLDLADLIYSHFMNKADHEHGLHWVGNPFLWGRGLTAPKGKDLVTGPSRIVEVGPGGHIELIQASGDSLGAIVEAMDRKEKTMAMLGARLLEDQPSVQDTATATRMRHGGEHATLRTEAGSVEADLTRALQMHAWWHGTEANLADVEASVELNKDFLPVKLTADELKALVLTWQADGMSWDNLHYNMTRGDVMRPNVTADEEKAAIRAEGGGTPQSFPNVADSGDGEGDV